MTLRNYTNKKLSPLLITLEKKLKTDVRYLLSGGGTMILGQGTVTFIALLTSIAFANLLSKEAYGTYQYILTTAEFLTAFSLIGLGRAVVTSVARGHDGALDQAFKQGLLWGCLSIISGLGVGIYYYVQGDLLFAFGIGLGTTLLLVIASAKVYIPFLNGRKLFRQTSSFTVIGLLIPSIVLIIALLLTKNLLILLVAFLLTSALTNVLLYGYSRRYKRNNKTDPRLIPEAVHLTSDAIIARVGAYADRLVLFQFFGPVALAEFWIAMNIERQFSHLFKSANTIVAPKLSNRPFFQLQRSLPLKILYLYALIIPGLLLYLLFIPYLIQIFFPLYTSITLYTQALGFLFLFLPFKIFFDALISHQMHSALYRITILTAIPKIIATVIIVPQFGIWGVIMAIFIEQIAHASLVLWFFFTRKTQTELLVAADNSSSLS